MQSKLPEVGITIFSVMSKLAAEHQAINLSQGFPDYPISPLLIDAVYRAMLAGHNQYAPMPGLPALRESLSRKVNSLYGYAPNPETEITITPGATYGIYTAFTTLLHPGDEAIVLEPAYDSYIPNIISLGAKPVCVPLRYPDYSVDWNAVKMAISDKTKVIIINSPHNPTGYVWTREDMLCLQEILRDTDIYVISDEVYEHLTFDGAVHESVLKYPELYARSFVVFSFGKVFHATGWKMGYTLAPESLMKEFRKIHQFLSFTCNTPMQVALAEYLKDADAYLSLPNFFEAKRDLFLEGMQSLPFTIHQTTRGSYFQLVGYEQISDLPDKEFAVWLTKQYGVATIPVSAFNHNGKDDKLIRFCFAKKEETILAAMDRLSALTKR